MRRTLSIAATVVFAVSLGGQAFAAGSAFSLQNDARAPVVSFQTREDDKWSANWLAAPVRPGEAFRMAFGSTSGDCQVRTRVTFQGGDVAEADIDYCDAQKVLRVTAQGISWK